MNAHKALLILSSFALSWGQVAGTANSNYQTKEGRDQIAKTLANPNRDKTQKPEAVVAALKLKPGMTVADIGTGVGYMLPFLSKAVGDSGKVLAEDIQTDFLDRAKAKAAADQLTNIEFVLGTETDPKLPAGAVDVALVLDVYHHFDYPEKMLSALARGLKPSGHIVIVEFYKANGPSPGHIRLDRDEVIQEVERFGLHLLSKNDHITDTQYLLTFVRGK